MAGTLIHEIVHVVLEESNSFKTPNNPNVEEKPRLEENNFHRELNEYKNQLKQQ
jgi:Zn-dependent peptidase ImmA (M78 family)